ncbi:MAG TPA: glycosyltransferase family 2 protein [Anaerolineaceae bacterium]|jgi:glycosyltransferase involved in cell wall biosynthesis|nr:glycosyltransferase family 2 protein [Anaerolineaceae bacterium]HQM53927.1 glycosyltransferase family 2 protein [Anaerolineaceae bacterium]
MAPKTPFLSIVFPAYNEELRLLETLQRTLAFIHTLPYPAEIVVAENGSVDGTFEIARSLSVLHPEINTLHLEKAGKGRAVQAGMLAARGCYRFICDVDLSMPIEEVPRFLPPQIEGEDIVIASREAPGAMRYDEPWFRHFIGRIFNNMVRWMVLPKLQDTQCGFKCFSDEAAEALFPLMTIPGWTFDVEVLAIAFKMGFRVKELPIPWYYHPHSKVRVVRDSVRMASDLLKIRRNLRRGEYDLQG